MGVVAKILAVVVLIGALLRAASYALSLAGLPGLTGAQWSAEMIRLMLAVMIPETIFTLCTIILPIMVLAAPRRRAERAPGAA